MRFATANGIFLVLPQAVGFTIYPRLAVEPHPPAAGAPHSPLSEAAATRSCSHDLPLRQPHHRQQRRARESPRLGPLKVATTAQTTGLSCATRKQQRRQQLHLPSNSRSGTTVKQRGTMSLTATSTTTTTGAAEISVSSASGAGAEDTAVVNPSQGEGILGGGGLRCAIVGVGADAVGLRLGQRFGGVVITSIDKLMKGRKGRKTEKVKANAVSKWLTEEGGVGKNSRCTRLCCSAMPRHFLFNQFYLCRCSTEWTVETRLCGNPARHLPVAYAVKLRLCLVI